MPDEGKGSRASTFESVNPTTIQIQLTGRFFPNGSPEMLIQTINYHLIGLWGAGTANDIEETRGYHHLSPHCCPQIMGLKVIGDWCQCPHQCHHCQTSQKAPSIPSKLDDVERLEPTWKLFLLTLKTRMQKMLWPMIVGGGIWWYTIVQDAEIEHSSCTPLVFARLPWRIGTELRDGYNLWWCVNNLIWTL